MAEPLPVKLAIGGKDTPQPHIESKPRERDELGNLPETNATADQLAKMGALPGPKVVPPKGGTLEQEEYMARLMKAAGHVET